VGQTRLRLDHDQGDATGRIEEVMPVVDNVMERAAR